MVILFVVGLIISAQENLPKDGHIRLADSNFTDNSHAWQRNLYRVMDKVTNTYSNEANLGFIKVVHDSKGNQLVATPFSNGYVRVISNQ